MKKYLFHIIKYLILTLIAVGIIILYAKYPFPIDIIKTIQSNLITVSGILVGIVIAYLLAKQFQIRQNRENLQNKLDQLSDKLTNFRKLLYQVMKSHDFWVRYSDIQVYKNKYQGITFTDLHDHQDDRNDLVRQFWLDEEDIDSTTADLYLAMEEINWTI